MSVLERNELERSPLADLHAIPSELGIEGFRRLRRGELIAAILAGREGDGGGGAAAATEIPPADADVEAVGPAEPVGTDGVSAPTDAAAADGAREPSEAPVVPPATETPAPEEVPEPPKTDETGEPDP